MAVVLKRPRAEEDLENIWFRIAVEDPRAATRLLPRIAKKLARVAQYPYMGRARPELGDRLQSIPVRNYVVVYMPLATGVEGIEGIRVFHSRQDIDGHFQMPGGD